MVSQVSQVSRLELLVFDPRVGGWEEYDGGGSVEELCERGRKLVEGREGWKFEVREVFVRFCG